jgi:hypothetical protein
LCEPDIAGGLKSTIPKATRLISPGTTDHATPPKQFQIIQLPSLPDLRQ